jgi:hypothetical protein
VDSIEKDLARLRPDEVQALFHQVFNTDSGRIVLCAIKQRWPLYDTPFNADNARVTDFNCGTRAVICFIDAMLRPIDRETVNPAQQET